MNGTDMAVDRGEHLLVLHVDAVEWLHSEFSKRHHRNPSFSLRAFARFLGVAPGPLSEILGRKRQLSVRQAELIAKRLGFTEMEKGHFLALVENHSASSPELPPIRYRRIAADNFAVVADWYHLALLSLFETRGFQSDEAWMARRLGISLLQVRSALERLERLHLCEKRAGAWVITEVGGTSTPGVPSEAIRSFHRQNLERAISIQEQVPMEERDFTSMTIALDPSKLAIAKKRIKRFRRSLSKLMESGGKTEVYQLNIQLMPVTIKEPK